VEAGSHHRPAAYHPKDQRSTFTQDMLSLRRGRSCRRDVPGCAEDSTTCKIRRGSNLRTRKIEGGRRRVVEECRWAAQDGGRMAALRCQTPSVIILFLSLAAALGGSCAQSGGNELCVAPTSPRFGSSGAAREARMADGAADIASSPASCYHREECGQRISDLGDLRRLRPGTCAFTSAHGWTGIADQMDQVKGLKRPLRGGAAYPPPPPPSGDPGDPSDGGEHGATKPKKPSPWSRHRWNPLAW